MADMNVYFHGFPGMGCATYLENLIESPPKGVNYYYGRVTAKHPRILDDGGSGRLRDARVISLTGAIRRVPFIENICRATDSNIPIVRYLKIKSDSDISLTHSWLGLILHNKPWVVGFDHARLFYYFRSQPTTHYSMPFIIEKILKSGNCKKIIPRSEFGKRSLLEYVKVPEEKIEVVPPGLSMPQIQTENKIKHEKKDCAKTSILFVGTQFKGKGGDFLLEAFKNLHERFPDLELVVAGSGNEVPDGIDGVRKYPKLPYERMAGLYRQADIFCFPTLIDGYGISLLEAMAYSLPVVATGINAIPEIVERDKTGFLVNPGNAHELESALARLVESESLRRKMGRAGRVRFERNFSTAVANKKLGSVYRGAVE